MDGIPFWLEPIVSTKFGCTLLQQDEHAIASYERAAAAQALGVTKGEIVSVTIEGKKPVTVNHDEECLKVYPSLMLRVLIRCLSWS
jgi:hypothetical protein